MKYYPIILIPEKMQSFNKSWRKYTAYSREDLVDLLKPKQKDLPEIPSTYNKLNVLFILVAIALLLSILYAIGVLSIQWGLILVIITVVCTYSYDLNEKAHYQKALKAYNYKLKRYDILAQKYKKELSNINQLGKRKDYFNALKGVRLNRINKKVEPASYPYSNLKRGYAEEAFEQILNKYFPSRISTNLALTIFKSEHVSNAVFKQYQQQWQAGQNMNFAKVAKAYIPDFIYEDAQHNLFIDIEIDEPYAYHTKDLIHYSGVDNTRNKYFLEHQWVVIRFSEAQILRSPLACCKTLAIVIYELTGDKTALDKLASQAFPALEKQWTVIDATQMLQAKVRDNYPKTSLLSKVNLADLNAFWEGEVSLEINNGHCLLIDEKQSQYIDYTIEIIPSSFQTFYLKYNRDLLGSDLFLIIQLNKKKLVLLNPINMEYLHFRRKS